MTTSTLSRGSNPSRKPLDLRASDARKPIYAGRFGLRALWTDWSVEVRVFSGALGMPREAGLFASRVLSVGTLQFEPVRSATGTMERAEPAVAV